MADISAGGGFTEAQRRLVDRLPPEARRRFVRLRGERDDVSAAMRLLSDRRMALHGQLGKAQEHLRRTADAEALRLPRQEEDSAELREAKVALDRLKAELADVDELTAQRQPAHGTLIRLCNRIFDFIAALPAGHTLVDSAQSSGAVKKGEKLGDAIERCRRRVREIDAEREDVDSAPLPSSTAKAIMRRRIDALAEAGRPRVLNLIERGGNIEFSSKLVQAVSIPVDGDELSSVTVDAIDLPSTLSWLMKPALVAALEAEIDRCADDGSALTPEAKAAKLAELDAEKFGIECDEVALVEQARAEGLSVRHRDDIDSRAAVGIDVVADAKMAPTYRSQQVIGPRYHGAAGMD